MTPVIGMHRQDEDTILHTMMSGASERLSHGGNSRLDENNLMLSATSNTPQCQTPMHMQHSGSILSQSNHDEIEQRLSNVPQSK